VINMSNPVEIYYGTTRLFRFDPMPTGVSFHLSKAGNSPMDLPTWIRPWMFDFTSQQRSITIRATIIPSTYNSSYPGSGSIADQIEDLLYIMSCNWYGTPLGNYPASGSGNYLLLFVPYPAAMDSTHNANMAGVPPTIPSTMYPPGGNADYELDAASVPGSGVWPAGMGVTRAAADKIYYIYPQDFDYERDEASVNRVHVTLTFTEVQDSIKI